MSETKISAVLTVEGLRKFQSDMSTAADAVDNTAERGSRAGAALGKAAKVGFLAAGAAAVVSVKKFASFDDALNRVQINSGASAKEMAALEKAARKMGEKFPASAVEVADAMNEILKAGMSVEDMMSGGLENALAMATAEGMEMATAAGAMSQAMSVFAIEGKNANQVTAALSNVASATSADVNDLTLSLGQVGGTAAAAGMSVGETSAALGVLIQNGLDGSKAGTALNSMLLALRAPTDKAAKALKAAGVEVYDATGRMKPFRQVLGNVSGALAKMSSDQERAAFLQKTFGVDAQQAASILSKQIPLYDSLAAGTQKLDAPVQKARDQMKSLGMQLDTTGESLSNMAMKVGGALAPAVAAVLPQVRSFADSIGSNTGGIEAFANALVQIGTGVTTAVLPPLQIAASVLSSVGSVVSSTNGGVLQFAGTLATVAVAARLLGPAMLAVKTSMIVAAEMAAVQAALSGASGAMGVLAGTSGAAAIGVRSLAAAAKAAMMTVLPLVAVTAVATAMFTAGDSARNAGSGFDTARVAAQNLKAAMDDLAGAETGLADAELGARESVNQLKLARENAARVSKDANATEAQRESAVLAVERAELRTKDAAKKLKEEREKVAAATEKAAEKDEKLNRAVERSAESAGKADDAWQKAATKAALLGDAGAESSTGIASSGDAADTASGQVDSFSASIGKLPNSKIVTIKADTSGFGSALDYVRRALDSLPTSKTVTVRTKQAKADGGPVVAMAAGGRVNGPGTGTSDSVPAMLSAGEWVLTAKQARGIGYGTLAALPHFAQGGAWFTNQATAAGNLSAAGSAHWKAMERAGTTDDLSDDRAALAAHAYALQQRLNTIRNEASKGDGAGAAKTAAISSLQGMIRDVNASIWQIDNIAGPAAAKAEADRIAGLRADEAAAGQQAAAEAGRAAAAAAEAQRSAAEQAAAEAARAQQQAAQAAVQAVGAKGSDLWKKSSFAGATATLDDDLAVLREQLAALRALNTTEAAQRISDTEADIWTMENITMPAQAKAAADQRAAMENEAAMAMGRGFYAGSGGAGGGSNMGITDSTGGGASGVGHAPRPEIDRIWLAGEQLNDLDARSGAGVTITEILGWDEAEDMESTRSKRADGDALGGVRDGSVKLVVQGRLTGSTYQDYHTRRRALKALVRAATTETLLKVPDVTHGDEAGDYADTYADTGMAGMERRRVRLVANIKWGDTFGKFGSEFEFELRSPHRYVEADVAAEAPSGTNAAAMTASAAARTSILAIRGEVAASPAMDAALKFAGTSAESVLAVRAGASSAALDTFTKLTDPATLPASTGNGGTFSPDGTYLAVAHNTSPYVTIYKRSGDTFTKLADPATLPAATSFGAAFSADGTYLAVAHNTSPYVTIYKRSGDTFTKLTDPATLPGGNANGAAFSADGTYLAVLHDTSPYVTIYKRSGDTFTKLTDPATLPGGSGRGAGFSADGTYLSVAHFGSPYVTIYKRSGDTFTKLTDPATLPPITSSGAAFDPSGTYMAVAHFGSPYVTIYKRSGDVFTKLANPATLPGGDAKGVAFDPSGTYLTVAHETTPFVTIYKRSGDVFTKLANPSTIPASHGNGAAFDPSGAYMAIAHTTTPFVTIYGVAGSEASYAALGTLRINPPALAISARTDLLPVASADISTTQPLTNQDAFEIDTIAGTATPIHRTPLARLIGGGSFVAAMIPARNANANSVNLSEMVTRSKPAGDAIAALGAFTLSHTDVANEAAGGSDDYIGVLGALTATSAQVVTGLPGWRAKRSGADFSASTYARRRIDAAIGQPLTQPVIHCSLVLPPANWATAQTALDTFGALPSSFAHYLTHEVQSGGINYVTAVGLLHNNTRMVPACARYDDKGTDAYRLTYANAALSITPTAGSHVWACVIVDAGSNVWTAIALLDINTGEPLMWFAEGHDVFDGGATETTGAESSQTTTTSTSGTLASDVAYPTGATRYIGVGTASGWAASVAGLATVAGGMGPIITLDAAAELFDHGIASAATLTDASTATDYSAISAAIVDWIRNRFAPQTIRRAPIALEAEWADIVPELHGEPIIRLDSVVNSDTLQDLGASHTGGVSTQQMVTAGAGGIGATPLTAREVR